MAFFSDAAKEFTIRIEPDDWEYIYNKGRGRTYNKAFAVFIRLMKGIEAEALAELRGYFTADEWKFLAEALKKQREPFTSKEELQRLVMMIKNLEATSSYYNVRPVDICEKISGLSSAHVLAITERVNEFWHRSEAVSFNDWAQY